MTKTKRIILIAMLIVVAAAAGWYGFKKYEQWSFWRDMKLQADKFTSEQDRLKALIEADTYGGKTPQETLEMFIKAVEAGDYELASKYFVVEKQGEWKENLSLAKNIEEFVRDTKEIKNNINFGRYSPDQNWFFIEKPIYTEFIKYPSNLWKINEI
jgi:hypothetical protein